MIRQLDDAKAVAFRKTTAIWVGLWCSVLSASPATAGRPASAVQEDPDAATAETAEWIEHKGTRFRLYGFPRVDLIFTDSRLAPNNQFPFFVVSEDPTVQNANDEEFDLHPRLTRIGIEIERDSIPRWSTAKLSAKIELDFQNGGSESRQAVRMRQAYISAEDNSGFSFLAGQTWDVIGPLYPSVNADGMMWNAGNLGDRRPQIRVGYRRKMAQDAVITLVGAIARPGAINNRDLDGDGTADGIDSGLPMLQARVGLSKALGGKFSAGLWGHYGWEDVDTDVAGESEFTGSGIGADLLVRCSDRLSFAAEIWTGENLDDVRGGVGQGVNTTNGNEISASGGWTEVRYKLTDYYTSIVGLTLDDPSNGDLDPGTTTGGGPREKNRAFYFSNHFDLGGGFKLGVEYINWKTWYGNGLDSGDANRLNFWALLQF